uniref:Uncharacterized protein n=1 Tax=Neolamprologus brichardi TaxID=32507 RepID=A0A3Q4GW40_NEOBR
MWLLNTPFVHWCKLVLGQHGAVSLSEPFATCCIHGAVFTFGSGQHGQLGHNSLRNELRPRLVAELWGAKVTKIACGRNHTLVLTESKKVYSFGCEDQGQLGHREESNPSVPLPVRLPQGNYTSVINDLRIQ